MTKYPNPAIKSYVLDVFKLTPDDYYILGEFSKIGETYRNRINLARLSDRQVSRRIDVLYKKNFLTLIKSIPYRNIPGRNMMIFGLTFKGLLASLYYVDLENTYLFKLYKKLIESKISLDILPFYEKYIKYSLIYFLIINKIMGIKFDDMSNVANWFDNVFDITSISNIDEKLLKDLKNDINQYSNDIEAIILGIPHHLEQMANWYYLRNYWYHVIVKITEGKKSPKILSEMRKEHLSEFENDIKLARMEQLEIDLKENKKIQLKVDKLVGHNIKSTKKTK